MSKALRAIVELGVVTAAAIFTGPIGASIAVAAVGLAEATIFKPQAAKPEGTETALKSPTPARQSGYGVSRDVISWSDA